MKQDFLANYRKLNRIGATTDHSEMSAAAFRDWLTIIDRAQRIIRLEAEQAGVELP